MAWLIGVRTMGGALPGDLTVLAQNLLLLLPGRLHVLCGVSQIVGLPAAARRRGHLLDDRDRQAVV